MVRNSNGDATHWKPGSNFSFSLSSVAPLVLSKAAGRAGGAAAPGAALLGGVAVRDAWDGAERDVQVEVVEARGGMSEAERREQDAYRESVGARGGRRRCQLSCSGCVRDWVCVGLLPRQWLPLGATFVR